MPQLELFKTDAHRVYIAKTLDDEPARPCTRRPCYDVARYLVAIPYETFGAPPEYRGTRGHQLLCMCPRHAEKEMTRGT